MLLQHQLIFVNFYLRLRNYAMMILCRSGYKSCSHQLKYQINYLVLEYQCKWTRKPKIEQKLLIMARGNAFWHKTGQPGHVQVYESG